MKLYKAILMIGDSADACDAKSRSARNMRALREDGVIEWGIGGRRSFCGSI